MNRSLPTIIVVTAIAALALGGLDRLSSVMRGGLPVDDAAAIASADSAAPGRLTAEFLGQDGHGSVGINCTVDETPDNVHLAVRGTRTDVQVSGWEVHDVQGCGHWILPCNNFNWWLEAVDDGLGTTNLYVKPHRNAPEGTLYVVIARYADGSSDSAMVTGSAVAFSGFGCADRAPAPAPPPSGALEAEFLGQDGHGYVGPDCRTDPAPDNIHIRVTGVAPEASVVGYQVDDPEGYGRWVYPCNSFNWWLHASADGSGTVDLFVKPHRYAPAGTPYRVTLRYADGSADRVDVTGSAVHTSP